MTEYRIKGNGDVREVWDGERLVGTIHRFERPVTNTTYTYGASRLVASIQVSKRLEARWKAVRVDGSEVCHPDGRRVVTGYMKDWRKPQQWANGATP